jgi:hypothetical protein
LGIIIGGGGSGFPFDIEEGSGPFLEFIPDDFGPAISSNSSIVGKCCANSVTLPRPNWLSRGDDDADDDGDGGPKLEVGTSAWGVGTEIIGEELLCGCGNDDVCTDIRFGGDA